MSRTCKSAQVCVYLLTRMEVVEEMHTLRILVFSVPAHVVLHIKNNVRRCLTLEHMR